MPSTRSPSVAPSDSVSHIGSRVGSDALGSQSGRNGSRPGKSMSQSHNLQNQPATRPSEYPEEVLWSLEDCKSDPNINVSSTNASRPSMEKALRHANATMITSSEWSAIKVSARAVKANLLSLPPPRDRRAKDQSHTKVYFRTYFRREWDSAVAKLESYQPLLALCSSHWKADHVLGIPYSWRSLSIQTMTSPIQTSMPTAHINPKARSGLENIVLGKGRDGRMVMGRECHQISGQTDENLMICRSVSPSTTSTNWYSYSYSVATRSNVSENSKAQMPSSSFMRGVNASTQPVAVDISFI